MIPILETILYKLCRLVYEQYYAQNSHEFNPDLDELHRNVESHLQIEIHEEGDKITISYVLDKNEMK